MNKFPILDKVEVSDQVVDSWQTKIKICDVSDVHELKCCIQKQAHELWESESLLAQAQHVAGFGVYAFDFTTGLWKSSANLDQLLGIGESYERSLVGWANLIHPYDRAMMVDYFNNVIGLRQSFDKEYRIIRQNDQAERWMHGMGMLEIDDSNRLTKMIGTIQDITERKLAQETSNRLAAIVQSSEDAIMRMDLNGIIGSWNRGAEKIFGYTAAEVVGTSNLRLIPADHQQEEHDILEKIRSGDSVEHFETLRLTKDGRLLHVSMTVSPIKDADGTVVSVSKVARDITERKKSEEALLNLQAAVEQSANTIVITDISGNIEYANPAFENSTGYTVAEAIGKNPRILKSGEQDTEFYRDLWATVMSKKIWRGEFHNKHKDGSLYWEKATISPIQNDNGETVRFLAIKEDITKRKAIEARLANALLHAEAANRAKSEFLGVMSHELRTPLNGVLGSAELLSWSALDSEQMDYVKMISSSGEHLLAIISDILNFASIEAGTLAIHVAPLAVADLVKTADSSVRKAAADKGIELRCDLAACAPVQITGDELRIRQILINLLGNAVKFTASGSVVLRVASDSDAGGYLNFSVEDTGIGISSEDLSRLFQPFVQADLNINRRFGGTGLGLAISRRIAEAMGGTITAASTPGKGSLFTFRFPLETASVRARENAPVLTHISDGERNSLELIEQSPAIQTDPSPTPTGGGLVLVVDDNRLSSMIAGKMLEKLGYRVEFAASGDQAVEAFVPGKFSAILMDMAMPMMDGLEATGKIREIEAPADSHVPIIAFAANVLPGERERCLAAGMDDFLSKPLRSDDLAAKLANRHGER